MDTDPTNRDAAALAALTASRICHDLVNPIGAVLNGVELLEMSVQGASEEMSLVQGAAQQALARVSFLRVALGHAAPDQVMSAAAIRRLLDDVSNGGRYRLHWEGDEDVPRALTKQVFLAILCLETAYPHGGSFTFDGQVLAATGDKITWDAALWDGLRNSRFPDDLKGAQVQFALLALAAGPDFAVVRDGERVRIRV